MSVCATCGASPVGMAVDGGPQFPRTCRHEPIYPGSPLHPESRDYSPPQPADDAFARIVVELDDDEMEEARRCGKLRFDRAEKRKAKDHFGRPSLDAHVLGAQGERAFSKWIGEPWECTTGRYGGASDVRGCQIRTVSRTGLDLKVRDNDPPRTPVVSVVGHPPRFWIRGWIFARDAKRLGTLDDPGGIGAPALFIPTDRLRPMDTFLLSDGVRAAMGLAPAGVD